MSRSSKGPPILRLEVSAADIADDKRLAEALAEIAAQNPVVMISPQESLYAVEGWTKSDLDSVCYRLHSEYHLAINVGLLEAVLVETIRRPAEAEGKYFRQTGGCGNYGHCKLRIEPIDPGKGYEFINEAAVSAIPSNYLKPIDEGIQAAMKMGILAGHPMIALNVTLIGGSFHETDSNEMAFRFAASTAFKEAARKARPVLLEPMMSLDIDVPEELTAPLQSEISKHRGNVERIETTNGFTDMTAIVPLAELLASDSLGIAGFPMEFAGYEPVQDNGPSDENGSGVTANRPNHPRPENRSGRARSIPEE